MAAFIPRPLTADEKRIITPLLGKQRDRDIGAMIHRRPQTVGRYRRSLGIPPCSPHINRSAKLKQGVASGPKKYIPCMGSDCKNWLWSEHKGHRFCDHCREQNESVETYAPIYEIAINTSKARRASV
jgi:hypothetical protein